MKLGATSFLWAAPFTDATLDLVAHAARLGLDVFEVPVFLDGGLDPGRFRAALEVAALEPTVICVGLADADVSSADTAVRERGIEHVRFCVEFAEHAGASLVVGPMYAAVGQKRALPDNERRACFQRAADGLREAADHAGERGIRLALEPICRFETDLVNTAEQGLAMIEAIGLANVGLCLDVFHLNIEERGLGEAIRAAGPRLAHFHACENDRGIPGTGHIPWNEIAAALRDVGYDGGVTLESWHPAVPSMADACAMWRPYFTSSDNFVCEGAAFLRNIFAPVSVSS